MIAQQAVLNPGGDTPAAFCHPSSILRFHAPHAFKAFVWPASNHPVCSQTHHVLSNNIWFAMPVESDRGLRRMEESIGNQMPSVPSHRAPPGMGILPAAKLPVAHQPDAAVLDQSLDSRAGVRQSFSGSKPANAQHLDILGIEMNQGLILK